MLKDFRSIDVYWDKATRRIYEEIRSSSSDEKGRKLTVQIVNDGQIQDLTNVALNLYWETQDGENRGLDPFTALDPENGIYELYFRTGMLEHVGKLNAHLHLVDTTGAITSEPFTIFVFEGVDVDAMASEDELSALTQALVQVNNLETTYAKRLNEVEDRLTAVANKLEAYTSVNISSNFAPISGVTNFFAWKVGTIIFFRFTYKPSATGVIDNVIGTLLHKPVASFAVNVSTHNSNVDLTKGIAATFKDTGVLEVRVPSTVPQYAMLFSGSYIQATL